MTTKTRLPPHNLDAEKSVLGCLLIDDRSLDEVADVLRPEHFYLDTHQLIYSTIMAMRDKSKAVDAMTLGDALESRGKLGDVGGAAYLLEVLETVPHSAHVKHYAEIVRRKATQRNLARVCTDVLEDCYAGAVDDDDDLLAKAEKGIFNIFEQQETGTRMSMDEIMHDTLARLNDRMNAGRVSGLPTGFAALDHQTNGLHPSELIIVAARPSMGKTALVCNIAEWVTTNGTTAVIFSLEQSKLELAERFLCIRAKLDGHRLRKGVLESTERTQLLESANELSQLPVFIDDQPGRTVAQISAICRRLKRRSNLGLVIIDYLQLIEPEDKRANREQQIAQITRRLKGIAKENNLPVIALSQLNRGVELREDKTPRLADLRESGAIEQDADIVMFLHRPDAYNPEDRPGLAEIHVAKHRSGPTGKVDLKWCRESMRFEDHHPGDNF